MGQSHARTHTHTHTHTHTCAYTQPKYKEEIRTNPDVVAQVLLVPRVVEGLDDTVAPRVDGAEAAGFVRTWVDKCQPVCGTRVCACYVAMAMEWVGSIRVCACV